MNVECHGPLSPGIGPAAEAVAARFGEPGEVEAAAPLGACLG